MKIIIIVLSFLSFSTHAAFRLECVARGQTFILESSGVSQITASYNGEKVMADGLVGPEIVDIIAKFSTLGEITILAKVGQADPENYIFVQGKRISVLCR